AGETAGRSQGWPVVVVAVTPVTLADVPLDKTVTLCAGADPPVVMVKFTGLGVNTRFEPPLPMVSVMETLTEPFWVNSVSVPVYTPLLKLVLFTESVATDPLREVLTKETPPEPGVKLKPVIDAGTPFTVTETFCDPACPPETALKEIELGLANT